MTAARSPSPEECLPDIHWDFLDAAVERLEAAWRSSSNINLADFVPPTDSHVRTQTLIELIKVDQEYRWQSGERKHLEKYLEDWPEIRSQYETIRELVKAECLTGTLLGATPTEEEIKTRFSDVFSPEEWKLIEAESLHQCPSGIFLRTGQRFGPNARYEIRDRLGQGGMGTVYRAYDSRLHREVALKIPHLASDKKSHLIERFLRESRAASQIHHPNICPIYDADCHEGVYYFTMVFIQGPTLTASCEDNPISRTEAVRLVEKVARALAAVHGAGVLHRDIKPSNILMDTSGEPLLMDFGLARQVGQEDFADRNNVSGTPSSTQDSPLTQTGTIAGTRLYMAPELLRGEPATIQSDIYSLGIVLSELLIGHHTSVPEEIIDGPQAQGISGLLSLTTAYPEIDEALAMICTKATSADFKKRYASAEEFAEALHNYLQGTKVSFKKPPRRGFFWVSLMAFFALSAGIMLYLKTGQGTLKIQLEGSDGTVSVDQQKIMISGGSAEFVLPVGQHQVEAVREGCEPFSETVILNWRGAVATVQVQLKNKYITRWIDTEKELCAIELSHDGKRFYALSSALGERSKVFIYDFVTGKLIDTLSCPDETFEYKGIVIPQDNRFVFTTDYHFQHNDISRFDQEGHAHEKLDIGGPWIALINITPDGRKLAVIAGMDGRNKDENNDLFVLADISEGNWKKFKPISLPDEPIQGSLVFSADSRYAYLLTRPRKSLVPMLYEVAITPPDRYEVTRRLELPNGSLEDLAVISQGKKILISDSGKRCLRIVDMETLRETAAISTEKFAPGRMAINARCNLLAVLCPDKRKILFLDPEDGTVLETIHGLDEAIFDLRFTPDDCTLLALRGGEKGGVAVIDLSRLLLGRRIVFSSDRGGEGYQLYLTNPEGTQIKRLRKSDGIDCFPRWSPDGRAIAYLSNEKESPKIFLAKRDGKIETILEATDPVFDKKIGGLFGRPFDWSPDGEEIVFIGTDRTSMKIVNIGTGKVRTIVDGKVVGEYGQHMSVNWGHTNNSILLTSQHSASSERFAIIRFNLNEKTLSPVYQSQEKSYRFAEASETTDGKEIICVQCGIGAANPYFPLFRIDADGTNPRLVPGTENSVNAFPCWANDSRSLYYTSQVDGFYHLFRLDHEGGKPEQLTYGKWNDIQPDIWSLPPNP